MSEEQVNDEVAELENLADSSDQDINEEVAVKKSSRWVSRIVWLMLIILVAAAALVGYVKMGERRGNDGAAIENAEPLVDHSANIDTLRRDLDAVQLAITTLQSQVETLPADDLSGSIATLQSEIEQQLRLLNTLPSRMTSLEGSVASLAGISAGARQTFLLAEAEYYLQIANAQLQLANNPQLASLALGMADERVTQLSDPALIDVRRTIADELAALEVMEKPDLAGATLTLASLARVVESLPLRSSDNIDATDSTLQDAEQGVAGKAWTSVKEAMSGLVKVTPPEQAKLQLLSPDAEFFLRNNIAMQLQAARLALLRGEQAVFEQAIDDAGALLDSYFETESAQVSSAQQTLTEIRESVFTTAVPDISNSLRLLRQYRALSETNQ